MGIDSNLYSGSITPIIIREGEWVMCCSFRSGGEDVGKRLTEKRVRTWQFNPYIYGGQSFSTTYHPVLCWIWFPNRSRRLAS